MDKPNLTSQVSIFKKEKKNTHLSWIWFIHLSQGCNLFFSFEDTHLRCGIWFIHLFHVCKFLFLFFFLRILMDADFISSSF